MTCNILLGAALLCLKVNQSQFLDLYTGKKTTNTRSHSIKFDPHESDQSEFSGLATGLAIKSVRVMVELLHSMFHRWSMQCAAPCQDQSAL